MTTSLYRPRPGLALVAAAVSMLIFSAATAETVTTVNGQAIDSALVDFYLQSRTQRPASEASAEQRESVVQELTDIYLLTTQPISAELAKQPEVKAQLELQERGVIAQAVVQDFMARNPATDEEILAEYQSQAGKAPPLQFKARHILVETQAAAQDLVAQLSDGDNFEELAK